MKLKALIKQCIGIECDERFLEVVYAELKNGIFTENSEAIILKLDEGEHELKTIIISEKYCPGKAYFLEVVFMQEMLNGINRDSSEAEIDERINTIIKYVEHDA